MNQNTNIKLQLQIKDVTFTQSHRPEEAIPDSCEKCEPGFSRDRGAGGARGPRPPQ